MRQGLELPSFSEFFCLRSTSTNLAREIQISMGHLRDCDLPPLTKTPGGRAGGRAGFQEGSCVATINSAYMYTMKGGWGTWGEGRGGAGFLCSHHQVPADVVLCSHHQVTRCLGGRPIKVPGWQADVVLCSPHMVTPQVTPPPRLPPSHTWTLTPHSHT